MAQPFRAEIDQHDGRDHETEDRGHVGIIELAHGLDEVLPDTAGADEPHYGGAAHVDLEAQQRVGGEIGKNLRHRRVTDRLPARGAARDGALDRLHVDILDDLEKQLAQRAVGMDRDREDTRHRPEPEGDDEQQREDEFRHRAAEFQHAARHEPHHRPGRQIGRGAEAGKERADPADQRTEIGDEQRIPELGQPLAKPPIPFQRIGQHQAAIVQHEQPADIAGEFRQVFDEFPGLDFGDPAGSENAEREDDEAHRARTPAPRDLPAVAIQQRRDLMGWQTGQSRAHRGLASRAFSSEVDSGSREEPKVRASENAMKQ